MASTAMKTVEGHRGATRPNCTPAPGAHRALACVVLAASFALALTWLAQSSAGPGFVLLFLALLFLALHSLRQRAARCPSIRVKTFTWPSPPAGRAPRPDRAFGLPGPAATAAARI
mgnify:CR=1 FL=1